MENKENNNMENNDNIKQSVLEKIKDGEINMRPKMHFTFKVIALIAVSVVVLVTSSIIVSFMYFTLRISGHDFLLGFGLLGIERFLMLFPWLLLIIDVCFIIMLEMLLKHFKFGYRSPIIYLSLGILLVVLAGGFIIDRTRVHNFFMERAEANQLPVFGAIYEHLKHPQPRVMGICAGTVLSVNGNIIIVKDVDKDADDGTCKVDIASSSPVTPALVPGDQVFIGGAEMNGIIKAYGLHKIGPGEEY